MNNGGIDVGTKVKIVLTKKEVDWLMYELKVKYNSGGGSTKKLENALAEIEGNIWAIVSLLSWTEWMILDWI
ncbi:unnamed protein product [Linum trigynum]|uniref:Uncharacterized protein n=1 Tax=Linum trigynum TaxID=586398 RepID=A0AAV2C8L5_9ROSI